MNKIWLKIAKISGVVLIVLCICAAIIYYSDGLILNILEFIFNPLFWFLFMMAILAFLVLRYSK